MASKAKYIKNEGDAQDIYENVDIAIRDKDVNEENEYTSLDKTKRKRQQSGKLWLKISMFKTARKIIK